MSEKEIFNLKFEFGKRKIDTKIAEVESPKVDSKAEKTGFSKGAVTMKAKSKDAEAKKILLNTAAERFVKAA